MRPLTSRTRRQLPIIQRAWNKTPIPETEV
jgi:hypothetical protein